MASPIVFDVETQRIFQDVDGKIDKLGVSVVGVYNYENSSYKPYFEKDLALLFPIFEKASLLIGFNVKKFDLEVLKPYYVGNLTKFPVLDLLDEVQKSLGKRIALDDLVKGTLGRRKQGHGLLALNYFREGNFDELAKYCLSDVRLTKELYEFGRKSGRVYYFGPYGKVEILVNWEVKQTNKDVNLTLPI